MRQQIKKFFESSNFNKLIVVLAALSMVFAIFWLGTIVGYSRAEYSSHWAGHYAEVFGNMRPPFAFPNNPNNDDRFTSTNGAIGTVMAVNFPIIAVKNANEAEKMVLIGPKTVIRHFHGSATTTDIHMGDFVVTVGLPDNEGRIVATFIRVMPPPKTSSATIN